MMDNDYHFSDGQLRELLFEPEECVESTEVAQHVETCETCQIRLVELADENSIELEVSQMLDGYAEASRNIEPRSSSTSSKTSESELGFDHSVLELPTHPEMLGRIGRYEVERCIGSGGMGVVFKAIDTELNRPVAVKVLAPHLARNGASRQRFSRESRAAAAVVHEHVVAIHNVDSSVEYPYLVMQYVAGESLQSRVEREGPQSVEQILRIGIQAAQGLAAAHQQGIVHRDIKPANILLEDGVERLLITDFGLARTIDDASLTHTGIVAGTPNYMSPEQAKGEEVDHRTDLFSLGSVLYFVATGHPPFRAERAMGVLNRICHEAHRPVWQVNPSVPDELSMAIDRLLEKRPARRTNNAAAVAEALSRILQQLQNRRPRLSTRLRSWGRRHRGPATLAALLGLAVSVGIAWLTSSNGELLPFHFGSAVQSTIVRNGNSSLNPATQDDPIAAPSPGIPSLGTPDTLFDDSGSIPSSELSIVTMDRADFDNRIRSISDSLNLINRPSAPPEADPAIEYQRDLRALDQTLQAIDSVRN